VTRLGGCDESSHDDHPVFGERSTVFCKRAKCLREPGGATLVCDAGRDDPRNELEVRGFSPRGGNAPVTIALEMRSRKPRLRPWHASEAYTIHGYYGVMHELAKQGLNSSSTLTSTGFPR